jgi:hypothetical protein
MIPAYSGHFRPPRIHHAGLGNPQNRGRGATMRLNPPTIVIFLISLVLAALALVTKMGFVPIPRYIPHQEYWLAMTAYLVLMVGNLVRGL